MSGTGSDKPPRSSGASKPDYGVFDADRFWGHSLTDPAATDQPDAFDARVERAWHFMQTMFFTPDEYAALVDATVRVCQRRNQDEE
jgi:hypothetical protein